MKAGWFEATVPAAAAGAAGEALRWRITIFVCMATGGASLLAAANAVAEPLTVAEIIQPDVSAAGATAASPPEFGLSTAIAASTGAGPALSREIEVTRDTAPSSELVAALRGDGPLPDSPS